MIYESWDTKNWTFISGSGRANVGVGDKIQFTFNPANPTGVKITGFTCSHGGIHGTHWNGVTCHQIPMAPHDKTQGTTLTSSLAFTITSILAGKEQLLFELPVELPPSQGEDPGPLGASWTAEEGGTGPIIGGGDDET